MSIIVAVRPPGAAPGSNLYRNQWFGGGDYVHFGDASHWLRPFGTLREQAAREGFEFVTEDMVDLGRASALIMMDLPATPADIESVRRAHPHLKLVLQIFESAVGRLWTIDPVNHRLFDAVISYDDHQSALRKYFIYKIPAAIEGWPGPLRRDPWEVRKLASMVAVRNSAAPRIPRKAGIGMMRQGWRFSPATWINYVTEGGSLYGERIAVANAMASATPDDFDLFGPGWTDEGPLPTRACAKGKAAGSKLDFLGRYRFNIAFENCRNDCGYISEKIFDPLMAGTVPVYLGNRSIHKLVPQSAFVDARQFSSYQQLAAHLKAMPKAEWEAMRQAGEDYLHGPAASVFGADQNVRATLSAVRHALGGHRG